MNNEIIIIGGNHHNMLGITRALGENGLRVNLIVTNNNKYAFVVKSKYVKTYCIVKEDEKQILDILENKYDKNKKSILLPTSDFAAYVIDKNLDKLKLKFIVPNINYKQSEIIKYMNKYNQYILAKKYNINMAKSVECDLENFEFLGNCYPYIVKPLESIDGEKNDITICKNKKELFKAIEEFRNKEYKKVIIQEFIKYDKEITLMGCIWGKKLILPGGVEKIRRFPKNKGNVSYGIVKPIEKIGVNIKPIENLLKDINYNGMFDIEIFKIGKNFWLNEINFRNSGNSYVLTYKNIYLAYIYILLICNDELSNININFFDEFHIRDEFLERNQLLKKNISLKEYFNAKIKSKVGFIKNKKDRAPEYWKRIFAILRRINKNEKE